MENDSILVSTRVYVGLDSASTEFDGELKSHILAGLSIVNQNGAGKKLASFDTTTKWSDFKDSEQIIGNEQFELIPEFVFARTKILFDPPPPSSSEFYANYVHELLWRIRLAYE